MMNRARTRGIDHFGLTVGSLEDAIHDLRNALGAGLCYIEGPIRDPEPGWMSAKLGARGSCTLRIAALNVLGTNLELFDYAGAAQRSWTSPPGAAGTFFLLLRTPTPERIISRLFNEDAVVRPVEHPVPGYEMGLPSGIHLAIQHGPAEQLLGAVCLNRYDHDRALTEFTGTFGLREVEAVTAFGASGTVLAGDHGAPLAVLHGHSPAPRPANSDPGGHHVAFHSDDIDASLASLAAATRYVPRGAPETITDGPIAGDRWVYLDSPFGLQLEVINMPDGTLPYEAGASALRAPITIGAFA
ncbi:MULTISPECIES: hypothetical protein [Arthrobacter]|uniref:VOC domain-containing protein n=1 Tax=Arthrobacter terricola TaxID=2547396 RepID=A0A4R5K6T9_9MICC|nr:MULTISPECIES: hypothetical protein [Arthrobacter]MBT8163737.1 hypothetical protein [Arthrobacter sp. GN70]TDF87200.1 hypothetical protein E1809_25130 [Arthrobacter terricola]